MSKKTDYINSYNNEHYDRINMFIPKGYKEQIKDRAKSLGISMSDYIFTLISNDLNGIKIGIDEQILSDDDMALLKKWKIATQYYEMIENVSYSFGNYVIKLKNGYINDFSESRFVYGKSREDLRAKLSKSHKK